MKTKEEVIDWLKSQEWFEQFRTNTEKYKPFEEYIETYSNVLLFLSAFPWLQTPEGEDYWHEKNRDFQIWWQSGNN